MSLRFRTGLSTYGLKIWKDPRIRVSHPYLISNDETFVVYEWQKDDTGENLNKEKIEEAIEKADKINQEREEFFNRLFPLETSLTEEFYEMVEDFLHDETKPMDYLHDEIKLTKQDQQEAGQILANIL